MNLLIDWIIYAIAVFVAAYVLPGVVVDGFIAALAAAVFLGIVNTFIKPLLVLLTLPINILTLGLFILVINGLLVMLVSKIVPGFTVDGFWWALIFSIVLSIVGAFLFGLSPKK